MSIYFCNTDIVQYHLKKKNNLTNEIVPDTYDKSFNKFYLRDIKVVKFKELYNGDFNCFIKPYLNDKSFDGQVYYNIDKFVGPIPDPETLIYMSNVVTFLCEYRLLIGDNKLYGSGFMQGIYPNVNLPKDFIEKIISCTNSRYLCIDIGYIKELKKWAVVEINPPFSLDNYNIQFESYINFCVDACKYITLSLHME